MKKALFCYLSLLSLCFTSCQKENEDYGVHNMTTTVMVKQTGSITTQSYAKEIINATANITKQGALQISIVGESNLWEHLTILVDKPKNGLVGSYTLRSKDNITGDAEVQHYIGRQKQPGTFMNFFGSDRNIIEGSFLITNYDNVSRQPTVNGTFHILIKDVRNPTKVLGQTTDADNSDVTITGSFAGARLYYQ